MNFSVYYHGLLGRRGRWPGEPTPGPVTGEPSSDSWVRNPLWLALPPVVDTEQKVVGLCAVWPQSNFLALTCAGAYTVDWGDGIVQNFSAGQVASHEYDFNDPALASSATALPYKQAIVVITPQAGLNLTAVNLTTKHPKAGLTNGYSSGLLDLCISGPALSSYCNVGGTGVSIQTHRMLERVEILTTGGLGHLQFSFYGCTSLRSVSLLKTPFVTDLSSTFYGCTALRSVPLFDTSKVWLMSSTFYGCTALETLPTFNTSAVTIMNSTFYGCTALRSVPLFDTSKVTSMGSTFYGCTALETLPAFNTSAVTDMAGMLSGCTALKSVPLFDTSKVTSMVSTFNGCSALEKLPSFNTSAVINMTSSFNSCTALQSIPLFDTSKVTNMSSTFQNCYSLKTVPLFNTSSVTAVNNMFSGCRGLVEVPALNLSAVTTNNGSSWVNTCPNLARISATGIRFALSPIYAKLAGEALDEIYTNVPTVTSGTINVTGNHGTNVDNPSIATAKGWTVIG